ncbi:unnamed protein product, partial [marine sediment metagenome]
ENGRYDVVLEGLDESDSEKIDIEGIKTSLCEQSSSSSSSSSKGFNYELISKPDEIKTGESFEIEIKLENNDKKEHDIDIWSYVYRGNKCYCRDREENKKEFSIAPETNKIVALKNTVIDAEPGDYKLKVNIIKDNQKTAKQLTEDIKVVLSASESYGEFFQNKPSTSDNLESKKYPRTIYESTSIKAQKLIPLFIIVLLAILSAILLWKR